MKKIYLLLLIAVGAASCRPGGKQAPGRGDDERPVITVTIEPLRYFTEAIAGDRFTVVSMVPKGSSPETYDPSPQQLVGLAKSKAYFRIGYIGFEQSWMGRLADNAPHLPFFDASRGIDLIYDDTHHHHSDASGGQDSASSEEQDSDAAGGRHSEVSDGYRHSGGGVEPHVWNSAANARIIAGNILRALCAIDKGNDSLYTERYRLLCRRIEQTDSLVRRELSRPDADRAFMIYHPALSYFARDYGLRQIPIEAGGKEPSPAYLKELINTCRAEKVRVIFVQPEFDRRNAELIARQTDTRVVDINPLAYDWEEEMRKTAGSLVGSGFE